jgi:hypothetical protein
MPISNANLVFIFILLLSGSTLRAQINVSSSDICVCDGAPQQPFSVAAEGSAGPFFFIWSGPDGYASTFKEPSDITAPGPYELKVYNAFGCSFSYQFLLEACPGPTFQFDIAPLLIAE